MRNRRNRQSGRVRGSGRASALRETSEKPSRTHPRAARRATRAPASAAFARCRSSSRRSSSERETRRRTSASACVARAAGGRTDPVARGVFIPHLRDATSAAEKGRDGGTRGAHRALGRGRAAVDAVRCESREDASRQRSRGEDGDERRDGRARIGGRRTGVPLGGDARDLRHAELPRLARVQNGRALAHEARRHRAGLTIRRRTRVGERRLARAPSDARGEARRRGTPDR